MSPKKKRPITVRFNYLKPIPKYYYIERTNLTSRELHQLSSLAHQSVWATEIPRVPTSTSGQRREVRQAMGPAPEVAWWAHSSEPLSVPSQGTVP